jgi:hypothetical protein
MTVAKEISKHKLHLERVQEADGTGVALNQQASTYIFLWKGE